MREVQKAEQYFEDCMEKARILAEERYLQRWLDDSAIAREKPRGCYIPAAMAIPAWVPFINT